MADLASLSRRVTELEEENRALRDALECAPINLHLFIGLGLQQSRFLREIERAFPQAVPRARFAAMLDAQDSANPENHASVTISLINKKLARHDIKIRCQPRVGFYLLADDKARLDALLDETAKRKGFERASIPWRRHD